MNSSFFNNSKKRPCMKKTTSASQFSNKIKAKNFLKLDWTLIMLTSLNLITILTKKLIIISKYDGMNVLPGFERTILFIDMNAAVKESTPFPL